MVPAGIEIDHYDKRCRHQRKMLTSIRLRKRRTGAKSTESTSRPNGTIQNPRTGKKPKTPPNISKTPVTDRVSGKPGNSNRRLPSRMTGLVRVVVLPFAEGLLIVLLVVNWHYLAAPKADSQSLIFNVTAEFATSLLRFPSIICYEAMRRCSRSPNRPVFLGSSVVEQSAVNRSVASSNLARGAIQILQSIVLI